MNTYNYNFYCRQQKVNKYGAAPIELCVNINGNRTFISLPYKVSPTDFSKGITSKRNNEIKQFVVTMQNKLQTTISTLISYNEPITTQSVKNAFINGYKSTYTIKDLFDEYLKILEERNDVTLPNYRKYEMATELFYEVVEPTTELKDVTNADILKYKAKAEAKYKQGTAASYLTKLKSFFKFAKDNNKITSNPFASIKISKPKEEIVILSRTDYNTLLTAELNGRLERTRDFLILMANCGLAFTDMQNVKREEITLINGLHTINKRRIKTDEKFNAVILEDGVAILEKYNYDLSPLFISNSKTNKYAKELQEQLELHSVEKLHTHLMRHYYITSLIRKGIDIAIVKMCAGHANIQMTERYTHLCLEDVVDNVAKHI